MDSSHRKYIKKKKNAWKIFDRIYKKYDLLNHLLSVGLDFTWRKKLSDFAEIKEGKTVLDIATGTGDVLFSLAKHNPILGGSVGVDMSFNMLKFAKEKGEKKHLSENVTFVLGDANCIPVKSGSFDVATMAFGIRNVTDPVIALKDIRRSLAKNGRVLVLEFSLPKNRIVKMLHLVYLRYFLPVIGKIISGDIEAYRYLNKTIEVFPYGDDFLSLMKKAGFSGCEQFPLTMGVVTIYRGFKE